jgi:hypothetical protein
VDPIRRIDPVTRPWVPPTQRIEAVRPAEPVATDHDRLGVPPGASQIEIDQRFRAIVREQRPDLGQMSSAAFTELVEARRRLLATAPRTRIDLTDGAAMAAPVMHRVDPYRRSGTIAAAGQIIDLSA